MMNTMEKLKQYDALVNSGAKLLPVDIKKAVAFLNGLDGKGLDDAINELNQKTPNWFYVGIEGKEIVMTFIHANLGDGLINKYKLVKYPKLLEGAVYEFGRGHWRYFAKNEMRTFIEMKTQEELQRWNYYSLRRVTDVSLYTQRACYNSDYVNSTPFLDSKPELVVFKNGTYNMLTGEMKEHDDKDYVLNAHYYNLDISDNKATHTNALLDAMIGDNAQFLKEYIGYMFYRSHAPAQEMVFLKGTGGEGKSTLLNYLQRDLIGVENASAITPQELSGDKFQTAELLGKNVNVCADISNDFIKDSSILKRLTGGDRFQAQYKGIQGFTMTNYAKMIFSANTLPTFKDNSKGFADRLVVIPFINGSQRDDNAKFWDNHDMEKIKKEVPCFAYECIQEFRKVFNGYKVSFTKCDALKEQTSEWLFDNDKMAQFLHDAVVIDKNDKRGEIRTTLFKEYRAFLKANGYKDVTAQTFKQEMKTKGFEPFKSRNGFNDGGSNVERYPGIKLIKTYLIEN